MKRSSARRARRWVIQELTRWLDQTRCGDKHQQNGLSAACLILRSKLMPLAVRPAPCRPGQPCLQLAFKPPKLLLDELKPVQQFSIGQLRSGGGVGLTLLRMKDAVYRLKGG